MGRSTYPYRNASDERFYEARKVQQQSREVVDVRGPNGKHQYLNTRTGNVHEDYAGAYRDDDYTIGHNPYER
jgi:hypothetical protein